MKRIVRRREKRQWKRAWLKPNRERRERRYRAFHEELARITAGRLEGYFWTIPDRVVMDAAPHCVIPCYVNEYPNADPAQVARGMEIVREHLKENRNEQ